MRAFVEKMQIRPNQSEIERAIEAVFLEGTGKHTIDQLKKEILNYYSKMTVEQKKERLKEYQQKFKEMNTKLENNSSLSDHFDAYELILQFRKFILGALGRIVYTLVWGVKERGEGGEQIVQTATIGDEMFAKLAKVKDENGRLISFQESTEKFRLNRNINSQLKAMIKNLESERIVFKVDSSYGFFTVINEKVGTKKNFKDGKVFRQEIERLEKVQSKASWYEFQMTVSRDSKKQGDDAIFEYNIEAVNNSPESSSIFSAIGKYFADEITTKRNLVQSQYHDIIDPDYPNAGNLTEMYIVAKARLNKGRNKFKNPKRQPVSGQSLFSIYNEIKRNTEAFYTGGDFLMSQIKSFLGSNPSLTDFSTIKKTIQSFNDALSKDDYQLMEKELSKLLLQKINDEGTAGQRKVSKAISQVFVSFFKNLT